MVEQFEPLGGCVPPILKWLNSSNHLGVASQFPVANKRITQYYTIYIYIYYIICTVYCMYIYIYGISQLCMGTCQNFLKGPQKFRAIWFWPIRATTSTVSGLQSRKREIAKKGTGHGRWCANGGEVVGKTWGLEQGFFQVQNWGHFGAKFSGLSEHGGIFSPISWPF